MGYWTQFWSSSFAPVQWSILPSIKVVKLQNWKSLELSCSPALLEMFLITYLMFLLYDFNVVFFLFYFYFIYLFIYFFFIVVQISYWWLLRDLLLALLEDIWGHLSLVLIILFYIFCIVIKHFELLYMLQTIIVWKKFELDTCFILYLWNVWIFFL